MLLEDGQVFVGGTSRLAAGRLAKAEAKEIEARVAAVRQAPGFGAEVSLGAGTQRYRLRLRKGGSQDITITGDPGGRGRHAAHPRVPAPGPAAVRPSEPAALAARRPTR